METEHPQTEVRQFVGCWLDALNQRSAIEKWEKELDTGRPEKFNILPHIRESFGKVQFLQRVASEWVTAQSQQIEPKEWEKGLTNEAREDVAQLKERKVCQFFFADTQIVFAPLRFHKAIPMLGEALSILWYCSAAMLMGSASQIALRGAIDLGHGLVDSKGGPYGPVFSRLYRLESSFADYPRVVVGKRLYDFLHVDSSKLPDTPINGHTRFLQQQAQRMICMDDDGIPIVDYLGEHASRHRAGVTLKNHVSKAADWVNGCYLRFKSQSSDDSTCLKLANRYCRWDRYIRERIEHWQPTDDLPSRH